MKKIFSVLLLFADEYFDLNSKYNFLDRDVKVTGPLALDMLGSFNTFWNSKYSKAFELPSRPTDVNYYCHLADYNCSEAQQKSKLQADIKEFDHKLKKARAYTIVNEQDQKLLSDINREGERLNESAKEITCQETYFYADTPGKKKKHRILTKEIHKLVEDTEKKINLESPYFVIYSKTHSQLSDLLKKDVQVSVLTNSLHSTDAVYVAAVFNSTAGIYAQKGLQSYIYKGKNPEEWGGVSEEARDGVWGIHSKTATFDDKHTLIGTYNLDPRSRNINSEMAVVCKNNPELAQLVNANIEKRRAGAVKLNKNGQPVDGSHILFETSFWKKSLYWGIMIPSHIFKLLL